MLSKSLIPLSALCLLAAAPMQAEVLNMDFATSDISAWTPVGDATASNLSWLAGTGNPAGSLQLSGINDSIAGRAYLFQFSSPFAAGNSVTVAFDAMVTQALVGAALHYTVTFAGPGGISDPHNVFDIQNSINNSSFTHLSWTFDNVPTGADSVSLMFNLAAGAFVGAGGSVAVDNVTISSVPEPSTTAALAACAAGLAVAVVRRRKRTA